MSSAHRQQIDFAPLAIPSRRSTNGDPFRVLRFTNSPWVKCRYIYFEYAFQRLERRKLTPKNGLKSAPEHNGKSIWWHDFWGRGRALNVPFELHLKDRAVCAGRTRDSRINHPAGGCGLCASARGLLHSCCYIRRFTPCYIHIFYSPKNQHTGLHRKCVARCHWVDYRSSIIIGICESSLCARIAICVRPINRTFISLFKQSESQPGLIQSGAGIYRKPTRWLHLHIPSLGAAEIFQRGEWASMALLFHSDDSAIHRQ